MSSCQKPNELLHAVRTLAMLVRLNLPLQQGLAEMGSGDKVWLEVSKSIQQGDTLGQALKRRGELFPEHLVKMVETAEASPAFASTLTTLSLWIEESERLKTELKQALIYPWVLLLCVLAELAFLFLVIAPQVIPPLFSGGLASNSVQLLFSLMGGLALTGILVIGLQYRGDGLLALSLKVPRLRDIARLAEQSLWARGLAALLRVGVPLPDALEKAGELGLTKTFRFECLRLSEEVAKGSPFNEIVAHAPWLDSHLIWAIQIGENQENLVSAIEKAAERLERRFGNRVKVFLTLVEPLAILVLGLLTLMVIVPFWFVLYSGIDGIPL